MPDVLIYVVDDDPAVRDVLCAALQLDDHVTEGIESGEALLARVAVRRPDLILHDLNMPRLDGRSAVEALRRHPAVRDLPVIIISGSREASDFPARHLVQGVIPKPFDIDRVIATVRGCMTV